MSISLIGELQISTHTKHRQPKMLFFFLQHGESTTSLFVGFVDKWLISNREPQRYLGWWISHENICCLGQPVRFGFCEVIINHILPSASWNPAQVTAISPFVNPSLIRLRFLTQIRWIYSQLVRESITVSDRGKVGQRLNLHQHPLRILIARRSRCCSEKTTSSES